MENDLKSLLVKRYYDNKALLADKYPAFIQKIKAKAIEDFEKLGFPHSGMEEWKYTNLNESLQHEYNQLIDSADTNVDIDNIFQCDVEHLDTFTVTLHNGWFVYKNAPITKLDNGVIIGSLAKAIELYPNVVEKHFAQYAEHETNGLNALNTAFAQDGVFIYVPNNVIVDIPLQIVNIINTDNNYLIQPRNLIVLGKNTKLTLVQCDHSLTHNQILGNSVNEVFVDENAEFDYYKMQNKGNRSAMITSTYIHQKNHSRISTNTLTLNGGIIRNNLNVDIQGEGCESNLFGIYLVDKHQHVDNHTFINHAKPNSTSNELYKGVLDEDAHAVFSGKVYVKQDAQKTQAFQSNKNILLTNTAVINTKPQLEIYADDVKCSHGATVGQLDANALFYLRARGIGEDCARMLLMAAFAEEVIQKIKIEALRDKMSDLVDRRLRGELSICDNCMLHCTAKESISFNIDLTKI